jgi:hypothetical protein
MVIEPKHCSMARLKLISLTDDTNVCHFKISKNQLKTDKMIKKMSVFSQKRSVLFKKSTKS